MGAASTIIITSKLTFVYVVVNPNLPRQGILASAILRADHTGPQERVHQPRRGQGLQGHQLPQEA